MQFPTAVFNAYGLLVSAPMFLLVLFFIFTKLFYILIFFDLIIIIIIIYINWFDMFKY
jgi:hypothetical protein